MGGCRREGTGEREREGGVRGGVKRKGSECNDFGTWNMRGNQTIPLSQ